MPRSVRATIAGLGLLAACSAAQEDVVESARSGASAASGLPCDVEAILSRSCGTCHGSPPTFGAPMPLDGFGSLHAPARSDPSKKVYEVVGQRVHATTRPMPPPPNERLSADDLAILDRWIAAGAPAGPASCGGDGGVPPGPTPLSCAPDLHMKPAAAWPMPADTDDVYTCYGLDVTSAEKRHVVGIAPKIDNPAIVHHLLLFQADRSVSATPSRCSPATPASWRAVYGWAPGGGNFELPPEAGFPQEETTHYVVQIHYNNVNHLPGQTDRSGFDFCTTDRLRPNDADTLVFGTTNILIPPRSVHDLTCTTQLPLGIPELHMFAAFPHMHQLGTSITTKRLGRFGSPDEDLGGQTSWDFQNQPYVPIDARVRGGDYVTTRCAWTNNRDTFVHFGERSEDEMCFSFTTYWPKITSPLWSYITPAALTACAPTLVP